MRRAGGSGVLVAWLAATLVLPPRVALANPQGGVVHGGVATITGEGTPVVDIHQTSQNAVLAYDSFNIAEGETTNFHQPNSDAVAINRILEEDPQLRYHRNDETKEFELGGSSQQHIESVVAKLKTRYHVEVTLHQPKVPYRETIKARVEVQGRHKKQTGGRGQFGDCKCIFEPLERGAGFEFKDKIFGGAIPQQWRPAVEKGIRDAAARGAIAGYPLVDFKVELIDGSYHTVDSDDLSFQLAGRKAFKGMIEKAHPILLEPVMHVEVVAPQECSGDIMGDLNSRRGRIQGMDSKGSQQVIKAQVPMAEMLSYPSTLNSITAARGSYHMEFSHYDEVPTHLSQKIVQQAVAEGRVRKEEEE